MNFNNLKSCFLFSALLLSMLFSNNLFIKFFLSLYFIHLAIMDYSKKEVEYLDIAFIFTIVIKLLNYTNLTKYTYVLLITIFIWVVIEIFIFKDMDDLFFPFGIVDLFYIIIIFLLIKINLDSTLEVKKLFIIILSSFISFLISLSYLNQASVPYLFLLSPITISLVLLI